MNTFCLSSDTTFAFAKELAMFAARLRARGGHRPGSGSRGGRERKGLLQGSHARAVIEAHSRCKRFGWIVPMILSEDRKERRTIAVPSVQSIDFRRSGRHAESRHGTLFHRDFVAGAAQGATIVPTALRPMTQGLCTKRFKRISFTLSRWCRVGRKYRFFCVFKSSTAFEARFSCRCKRNHLIHSTVMVTP